MQHLSHILRKALSGKKLHHTGYMGIIFHFLAQEAQIEANKGFVKHGVLFLHIPSHGQKMQFFPKKQELLKKIQQQLEEYGYRVPIKDIRFL